MPKVFVIIVNYNGQKYLPDLFSSLEKIKTDNYSVNLVVVDNNSTDGSLAWLKERPDIHLITNQTNTGFAAGNNQGMQYALDEGADYIYLLNQDTKAVGNFLTPLVKVLEQDENIGAAQSLLLLNKKSGGEYLVNSWGNKLHFLGFGYCDGLGQLVSQAPTGITPITYASGAGVMYRATALQQVGLFDDTYFLYHEDTALSLKLKLAGYKIVICSDSKVIHKFNPQLAPNKYYILERNRYRLLLEFYKWPTLIFILPAFKTVELVLFILSLFTGLWKMRLKAYGWILMNLDLVLRQRRSIQKLRKFNDRKFLKSLTAKMELNQIKMQRLTRLTNPLFRLYWFIIKLIMFW